MATRGSIRVFVRRATMAVGVLLAGLCVTPSPDAQSQPGRLFISPRADVILQCNADGSNCFSVVGGDPTHQVSGARDSSVAADGTIAFESVWDAHGNCTVGGQGICQLHVFLMNANGTNVHQLTFNPADPSQFGGDKNAAISPDGTMVAFVSNRTAAFGANGQPNFLYQIYIVNTDGSNLRQITFPAYDANGDPHGNMRTLAWSPDSTKLAFSGNIYTTVCGTYFGSPKDVGVVGTTNADGTGQAFYQCLGDNGGATALDWSPDGTLISVGRESGLGEPAIAFVDLSGQGRFASGLSTAQLGGHCTDEPHHCIHFSPDGARLAYENQAVNAVSTINLNGTGRADVVGFGSRPERGLWWSAGSSIPSPAQFTLAPDPVEVWPGADQQFSPALTDAGNNLIFTAASTYSIAVDYGTTGCIEVGPFGLAFYKSSGSGSGTISATNAGLSSNAVVFRCWPVPPCTYSLTASGGTYPSSGAADSVGVIADPGLNNSSCPWRASTNDAWITITAGSSGNDDGTVNFTVAANSGPARQGTMTIAGLTYTVSQSDGSTPPSSADLSITKTDSPDPATVGSNLTYTITVTNGGPDVASGVSVSDQLPASVTFVSTTPSQGSCSGTSTVSCAMGSLANGASATVTIVVSPTQTGTIGNTATVSATEGDPNSANNSATQTTTVNPVPPVLSAIGPARLWIGQGDSVKQLKFDLLAEILVNGALVGSGQLPNISAGGGTFSQATLNLFSMTLASSPGMPPGTVLSIRASVRASCSVRKSGASGVARLWYNGQPIDAGKPGGRDAGTRFDAAIGGTAATYFLRPSFALSTTAGSLRDFVDVAISDAVACPARPFTAIGTWSITK